MPSLIPQPPVDFRINRIVRQCYRVQNESVQPCLQVLRAQPYCIGSVWLADLVCGPDHSHALVESAIHIQSCEICSSETRQPYLGGSISRVLTVYFYSSLRYMFWSWLIPRWPILCACLVNVISLNANIICIPSMLKWCVAYGLPSDAVHEDTQTKQVPLMFWFHFGFYLTGEHDPSEPRSGLWWAHSVSYTTDVGKLCWYWFDTFWVSSCQRLKGTRPT